MPDLPKAGILEHVAKVEVTDKDGHRYTLDAETFVRCLQSGGWQDRRGEHDLTDQELRSLLNAYMVSDPPPWDESDDAIITGLLIRQAKVRGFDGWADAYHLLHP